MFESFTLNPKQNVQVSEQENQIVKEEQIEVSEQKEELIEVSEEVKKIEMSDEEKKKQQERSDAFLELIFASEFYEEIKKCVACGANVHKVDDNGNTYLHRICKRTTTTLEQLKFWVELGIDINAKNKDNKNAIFYATYFTLSNEIILYLLDQGSSDVKHAFYKAIDGNNYSEDILLNMIDKISDMNVMTYNHYSLLNYSCSYSDKTSYKVIEKLITKGCAVNLVNRYQTALYNALCNKYPTDVIQLLLDHGAVVNKSIFNKLPPTIQKRYMNEEGDEDYYILKPKVISPFNETIYNGVFQDDWVDQLKECMKLNIEFKRDVYYSSITHNHPDEMKEEFYSEFDYQNLYNNFVMPIDHFCTHELKFTCNNVIFIAKKRS